jgi:hypothetical protein
MDDQVEPERNERGEGGKDVRDVSPCDPEVTTGTYLANENM